MMTGDVWVGRASRHSDRVIKLEGLAGNRQFSWNLALADVQSVTRRHESDDPSYT